MKEVFLKYRKWIVLIVVVLILGKLFFGGSKGYTTEEFEKEVQDASEGKIVLTNSKIERLKESEDDLYFTEWNGNKVMLSLEDDKVKLPCLITTPPAGLMDEIAIGQYHEFIQVLSSVLDEDLSLEDSDKLISNDLNFNHQIMNGTEHTTTNNEIKYTLGGGGKETTWYSLMIEREK